MLMIILQTSALISSPTLYCWYIILMVMVLDKSGSIWYRYYSILKASGSCFVGTSYQHISACSFLGTVYGWHLIS